MGDVRIELRRDIGRIDAGSGPWIRRKQIARIQGSPDPWSLARVLDRRGDTVGWGLVSPVSAITVRMLSYGEDPPPARWLEDRLGRAFDARRAYRFDEEGTTGYREVNSEGDGLPGLVIDRYEDELVLQITTAPMAAREDAIVAWLREQGHERIVVLLPESAARQEGFTAGQRGAARTEMLVFHEHGLRFEVPPPPGQKTGAYFDQRGNRRVVAHLAARRGGRLLDVGCHLGGFALHARRLGVPALGLDQSAVALELAQRNAVANGFSDLEWLQRDMFAPWDDPRLDGPFGTIVLDPPKIASKRSDIDRALTALTRVARQAGARIEAGGHLVLCSCSHHLGPEHLDRVALELEGAWHRVAWMGPGFDHPVAPGHREGEYLRIGVYQRVSARG